MAKATFSWFCWVCDWLVTVTVKWPPPRLEPRLSWLWQEWKAIQQCQLSYVLTGNIPQNSTYVLQDLCAMAGETMLSFWELQSTTFSWQSSWWWKLLRILFPTIQWIISWLGLALWWNSHLVGWMSDYEGHWSKEATNQFKILLVLFTKPHEKPWKRKNSFYCFVSQHFFTWGLLRMRPKVLQIWSAMRRRIRFFTCCGKTSWTNISI